MWPSLSTANQVANWANAFLIGSLVVGVLSTGTIVWMTRVKEAYWDADCRDSAERIALLTTQSDQLRKETAEANARVAEAELALAKFRTPRAALLTAEAKVSIINNIKSFAGTKFDVGHDREDREVWDFLWNLEPLLTAAGWVQIDWQGGEMFKKDHWPGDHWYGVANVNNVSIEVQPALMLRPFVLTPCE